MIDLLKKNDAFYKANMHCHTTLSDGKMTPEEVKEYYLKHGKTFYYHGFYPWFILGEMKINPETFIDVACMQHREQLDDGTVEKCADNMCPKEWFDYLLSKNIMPLMAPSLKEYPLYDLAFSYGSQIVNSDEPEKMLAHLKENGMHR